LQALKRAGFTQRPQRSPRKDETVVPDEIKGVRKLVFLKFLETTSPLKQSDGELLVAIVASFA